MSSFNFAKGVGVGILVGSAIGMAMSPHRKTGKSRVGKTLKSVGEVLENITETITS